VQSATFDVVKGDTQSCPRRSELDAISKRQTAIYDGAEFVSILSFLISESQQESKAGGLPRLLFEGGDSSRELPSRRAGFMTFVVGTLADDKQNRIVGIVCRDTNQYGVEEPLVWLDDDTAVYADSVAQIPKDISDADAIATAAAALCGVHCGMPKPGKKDESKQIGRAVVLGGGDYACFTARGLSAKGADVSLVSTRPMSLKDTPLNPLYNTNVKAIPPAVDDDSSGEKMGFAQFLGSFHSLIDTLADEAKLNEAKDFLQGVTRSLGGTYNSIGVAAKLKRDHGCNSYISTLTKSQKFVLDEGLLFARDPVIQYQKLIEKENPPSLNGVNDGFMPLVAPLRFGIETLKPLLDQKIIFKSDMYNNENGGNLGKSVFVRGWSFPDYTELEIWPRYDSTSSTPVRYGFPAFDELNIEAAEAKLREKLKVDLAKTSTSKTKKGQTNPYVVDISNMSDLDSEIIEPGRDCVLFVSAHYCKLCASLKSGFTRMARLKSESFDTKLMFANANTRGQAGKQITYSLQVEYVPTFILFRNGTRYGDPIGALKLPHEKLDLAIEYLTSGKEWDPVMFEASEEENENSMKLTKLT